MAIIFSIACKIEEFRKMYNNLKKSIYALIILTILFMTS